MYRIRKEQLQVFLVHPGGPFWAKKDLGAWSIPKGEYTGTDDPLEAAKREFEEETGLWPEGDFAALEPVKLAGGKVVSAWAFEGDCDSARITSNAFSLEWPPKSGKTQEFPEIDRAGWFPIDEAKQRINKGQRPLLVQLEQRLT